MTLANFCFTGEVEAGVHLKFVNQIDDVVLGVTGAKCH